MSHGHFSHQSASDRNEKHPRRAAARENGDGDASMEEGAAVPRQFSSGWHPTCTPTEEGYAKLVQPLMESTWILVDSAGISRPMPSRKEKVDSRMLAPDSFGSQHDWSKNSPLLNSGCYISPDYTRPSRKLVTFPRLPNNPFTYPHQRIAPFSLRSQTLKRACRSRVCSPLAIITSRRFTSVTISRRRIVSSTHEVSTDGNNRCSTLGVLLDVASESDGCPHAGGENAGGAESAA
ncbi:hypothetical protein M427DRAFT_57751 [Gonapodya prolifera JEL478]|uniref:Uncharacterized protein n=1 Tax=Gonapodya prolifera (strain JEL478) TaxID=1344416 RepID=A0A139AC18_GONPJ|nr:hypothetical protein M427DRAFT_57751 [Gonapodya prolifera JEL478]|eukprot:KXS14278.1 hypothetical protein M427DRAFT_57751 [Gonapodya prolifera JEL478]